VDELGITPFLIAKPPVIFAILIFFNH